MNKTDLILKHYQASNYIVLSEMYLKEYKKHTDLTIEDLKEYNPGHLGTSTGVNFILSNLNYFLNENNLTSKTVIGTGHSAVAILAQNWLNGELFNHDSNYTKDINGLNKLIEDFGKKIRSEINPKYPNNIYDGGELGYSLAVSYGYAINSEEDFIPCIIGDGEAETGTLSASWYLNKLLTTKSKVLPILNLNELKMSSNSYFSLFSNEELVTYFTILGYNPQIVDATKKEVVTDIINDMQNSLLKAKTLDKPLIIFRSKKGWGMKVDESILIEGHLNSHKNPLAKITDKNIKLQKVKELLKQYETTLFDENKQLIKEYYKFFSTKNVLTKEKKYLIPKANDTYFLDNISSMTYVENWLEEFQKLNKTLIFSPDEIYSNNIGKISGPLCFEMLNENVLQGLMQGYVMNKNIGILVSYEGFMPVIAGMIEQYWKYLYQLKKVDKKRKIPSINYILTSICWENTYSHQNPSFIDALLRKNDDISNIYFPKDGNNMIKCLKDNLDKNNCINIYTISKRNLVQYQTYNLANSNIEILEDSSNHEIILCATGDIMLNQILKLNDLLKNDFHLKTRVIYVTNPKIFDLNAKNSLTKDEFNFYFPTNVECLYLFSGYPEVIKSFLYDRNKYFTILGYNDKITNEGGIEKVLNANDLSIQNLKEVCLKKVKK